MQISRQCDEKRIKGYMCVLLLLIMRLRFVGMCIIPFLFVGAALRRRCCSRHRRRLLAPVRQLAWCASHRIAHIASLNRHSCMKHIRAWRMTSRGMRGTFVLWTGRGYARSIVRAGGGQEGGRWGRGGVQGCGERTMHGMMDEERGFTVAPILYTVCALGGRDAIVITVA